MDAWTHGTSALGCATESEAAAATTRVGSALFGAVQTTHPATATQSQTKRKHKCEREGRKCKSDSETGWRKRTVPITELSTSAHAFFGITLRPPAGAAAAALGAVGVAAAAGAATAAAAGTPAAGAATVPAGAAAAGAAAEEVVRAEVSRGERRARQQRHCVCLELTCGSGERGRGRSGGGRRSCWHSGGGGSRSSSRISLSFLLEAPGIAARRWRVSASGARAKGYDGSRGGGTRSRL
eukprot:1941494-Rhodomonas_salina.1